MAIFVDSGISRHSLFCSGGDESYYLHMCPTTLKFQDIAYTVDAVVLYVSVAVELWDCHQGTCVQNDQTQHNTRSPEKTCSVCIYFIAFLSLFILSTIWQSWMSHQFYSKWTSMDEFIFFCKICKKCSFNFSFLFVWFCIVSGCCQGK